MKINLKTIPHQKQRYDTVGDYWVDKDGSVQFRISEMNNPKYEWLIAIHEIVEFFLCVMRGVPMDKIDKFDLAYKGDGEPGDEKEAPYRDEHCIATAVERLLCGVLGVSWKDYENAVNSLEYIQHGEKYFKGHISAVE